jgi:3-oxosteroid 1-dehydrogenase
MASWDQETDLIAVGSGAAGLGAALSAAALGLHTLVVEAEDLVGGSTMRAGGGMWVPANHFMVEAGDLDGAAAALTYLEAVVGDEPPASTRARKEAFVHNAPRMIKFFETQGIKFRRTTGYPDYYPDRPAGSTVGRGVESVIYDTSLLGEWADKLPPRVFPRNLPMGTLDVASIVLAKRTARGLARLTRIYAHHLVSMARGQSLIGGGGALVAQLLAQVLRRDIPVLLGTRVVELVQAEGRVLGVVAETGDGRRIRVKARRGVMLGAGGFARNGELRRRYQPDPVGADWTSAALGDRGDGLMLGESAGAATALLDEAWWGPAAILPPANSAVFLVSERSKPGSLVVDRAGKRYFNESTDYVLAGQTMIRHDAEASAIPSYLLFDHRYRSRYPFGGLLPGRTPEELLASGFFTRADTIGGLAKLCDLPSDALVETIQRFNDFARSGVDHDFHRGENSYDTYYGDPRVKPNPCLAPLEVPPFYAVKIFPGDLGTKGGLVTDETGRVLGEDLQPIAGLYAAGNTSASVMGRRYPGPGATIAPALTFAWLAVQHAARPATSR